MTDITIPPEAVEAAARAICETENGPCKFMPDECGCTYWLAHARASISAALSAWPGACKSESVLGLSKWIELPIEEEQ